MAYDLSTLLPTDVTSEAWAVSLVRLYLRDRESPFEYADAELATFLNAYAFTTEVSGVDVTYYRPHVTAAAIIDTDPDRAVSESLLSASVGLRTPDSLARAIRRSGRWIDDLIETASDARPPSGLTLTPVF